MTPNPANNKNKTVGSTCNPPYFMSNFSLTLILGSLILAGFAAMLWPLDKLVINFYPLDLSEFALVVKSVLEGQILNKDILTPIGPYFFYPMVWGYQFFGTMASAINFAAFFHALIGIILIALLTPQRLSWLSALILLFINCLICVQPANLGDFALSPAMEYNKYCWSFLMIYFVALFLPGQKKSIDIIIICASFYILFMTKMSYACVAFVATFMATPIIRASGQRSAPILGLVTSFTLILLTPGIQNYLNDFVISAFKSGVARYGSKHYLNLFYINFTVFFIAFIPCVIGIRKGYNNGLKFITTYIIIVCGSFVILTQNYQALFLPSIVSLFVIFYEWRKKHLLSATHNDIENQKKLNPFRLKLYQAISVLILIYYPLNIFTFSILPFIDYATHIKGGSNAMQYILDNKLTQQITFMNESLFNEEKLAQVKDYDVANTQRLNMDFYLDMPDLWFKTIKDAGELTKAHGINTATAFTFDAINGPALNDGISLTPGWHLWAQTLFYPIPIEHIFPKVDIVFIPHIPSARMAYFNYIAKYGEYVEQNYKAVGQSNFWLLCTKKTNNTDEQKSIPCAVPHNKSDWENMRLLLTNKG